MSESNLNAVDPGTPGGTTDVGAADPAIESGTTASETAEQRAARLEVERDDFQRQRDELLRMKSNAEETARENERLRAQYQPPTAQPDVGQYATRIQRAQMRWQQVAVDPNVSEEARDDAVTLLALSGAVQQAPQQLNQRIDMLEVPKEERADVERVQREHYERGERISADTAKALLQARKLQTEAARVAKQADELKRAQEAKERGVVQTRTVGIPASEVNSAQRMTYTEFGKAWDSATLEQRNELLKKTGGGKNLVPG